MPTIDLSDEELQGLILVCANASGPGVSWMLTNALLAKAQQAAQSQREQPYENTNSQLKPRRQRSQPDGLGDMLDRNTALPQEH